MATATATSTLNRMDQKPTRVCFSFAAYAKNVIDHLKACTVPVLEGLTDVEFSSVEATFGFTFPPDLRSILREGLPVGPGFPNWRSSSPQQLEILINLPVLGICKEVSEGKFWCGSWGDEPDEPGEALTLAKKHLKTAPVLVPIYRHYYMPSAPNLAGNPLFFVQGADIRYSGFDVAGFFQQVEFRQKESVFRAVNSSLISATMTAPAWAAKSARTIEVWSDLVERGTCRVNGKGTCEWWRGRFGDFVEEVSWKLRDGGWSEEEVREMLMLDGDDDGKEKQGSAASRDREGVVNHVRLLCLTLLRAGWSSEDVVYSLGFSEDIGLSDG